MPNLTMNWMIPIRTSDSFRKTVALQAANLQGVSMLATQRLPAVYSSG